MSEKNFITGKTKDLFLAQLLENSKKLRIKSIAERYGIRLPDKYTKQQMIDAKLPAIEAHFGTKLKQYSIDDFSVVLECFADHEFSEQSVERIMASAPFSDGAIYIMARDKNGSYCAGVPHELAGKLMMSCVTSCFDDREDELLRCAKACSTIYGKFTATMLADCANNAFSLDITPQQAEAFLTSTNTDVFTYQDGIAVSQSPVSFELLPVVSGSAYYMPTRKEIDSYATYGADTSDYYFRQIINLIFNNAGTTYDIAGKLLRDISLWCTDHSHFGVIVEKINQSKLNLSTEKFNFLLGMIGELNSHSRKPCLKGHRPDEVDGYPLPAIPEVFITSEKPTPVKVEQKVGRNDPCPCGSGKKYKKCCGKNK